MFVIIHRVYVMTKKVKKHGIKQVNKLQAMIICNKEIYSNVFSSLPDTISVSTVSIKWTHIFIFEANQNMFKKYYVWNKDKLLCQTFKKLFIKLMKLVELF
jgi:hypothetical protein